MARYRRIDPYIWHDDKFPAFSDDAKLLWFHLLTTPRGNPLGCFVQGKTDMAEYLRWPMKRFHVAFDELLRLNRVRYDDVTRIVFLPHYLKYNPLENENQAKMALKYLTELPYNDECFQHLKLFIEQYAKPFLKPLLEGLTHRISIGNGIGNGTPNTEPYSLALTLNRTPDPETVSPLPPKGERDFDRFWKAYPKKKSKGDAEKAWKVLKPKTDLVATILTAIDRGKDSADWQKDGGQFIPYPATWLRAKGWEDEDAIPPPQLDDGYGQPTFTDEEAADACIHGWFRTPAIRAKHGDPPDLECGRCRVDLADAGTEAEH